MKSADADEIFSFASDEIKSTHPPSRRISSNEVGFHHEVISRALAHFIPSDRTDLVEKRPCQRQGLFSVYGLQKRYFRQFCV